MISSISRYWHTIRYLKPRQIYRRLWFRLYRPQLDLSANPSLRRLNDAWVMPARRLSSLIGPENFLFLNQKGRLGEVGWDGAACEKLWRYNQHYFDDLNAENAESRHAWHQALLSCWVEENSPGLGVGWDSYPTSLRIVNWVKWSQAGNPLPDACLQSLAVQVRWLTKRLEWHILGNHLFANAKALVFAGLFFDGREAQRWLELGLDIIARELPEQVLPDGGSFERSTMYHSILLEDVLDLINLTNVYPEAIDSESISMWRAYSGRMQRWLEGMCHPDKEIAFFNDAAFGIAPSPSEITAYADRLGIFSVNSAASSSSMAMLQFADSGYICVQTPNAVAFVDVAPIGPDYLPGHAHADTLSFELSLFGKRVIVNGGTSEYGAGAVRQQERSTAAHNTVEVNGENSSDIWSGFRVATRAYPVGLKITEQEESISISCGHDGYRRLSGRPLHVREWRFGTGKLVIRDTIEGGFESAVARLHFHPDVQIMEVDTANFTFNVPNSNEQVQLRISNGDTVIEPGFYAPEFGMRLESHCLAVHFNAEKCVTVEILWGHDH